MMSDFVDPKNNDYIPDPEVDDQNVISRNNQSEVDLIKEFLMGETPVLVVDDIQISYNRATGEFSINKKDCYEGKSFDSEGFSAADLLKIKNEVIRIKKEREKENDLIPEVDPETGLSFRAKGWRVE